MSTVEGSPRMMSTAASDTATATAVVTAALAIASPSIILTTLPIDLLAMTLLFLREGDLAQLLRTNKTLHASALDSDNFWSERCCSTFGQHVQCLQPLDKAAFRTFLEGKRHALDDSLWGRDGWLDRSEQLLQASVGASSQDQTYEAPRHTLIPSPCAMLLGGSGLVGPGVGQSFQMACGCAGYNNGCYWSSEPSPVPNKDEWLEYDLAEGLAVISSMVLTPYTSFSQPEQPTYNPIETCFQLVHPDVNQGKPYYESPRFSVNGSMTRQQFDLPEVVLSLGGRARILLLGMAQRQTLDENIVGERANDYYVCISEAALQGTILRSCRITETPPCEPLQSAPINSAVSKPSSIERCGSEKGSPSTNSGSSAKALTRTGLRLQWMVTVNVQKHPQNRHHLLEKYGKQREPSLRIEHILLLRARRHGMVVEKYDNTPCVAVIEEYAQKKGIRVEDVHLALMDGESGRILPSDGVLGDFAEKRVLNLEDVSDCGN